MPGEVQVSVIVPTRNRPDKLLRVVSSLEAQSFPRESFEIIVVDDGSDPPVKLEPGTSEPTRVIRLEPSERSTARNRGASGASGALLLFIDDDMLLGPAFIEAHCAAQRQWPGALAVGAVTLPATVSDRPFGRFRIALERQAVPVSRGVVTRPNLCTAGNMSIPRSRFLELGGFDPAIVSSEDQDLALRYTSRGGTIVFLPEALAIHDDDNLDIRSYCRRHEWGAARMIAFCDRYPELLDNKERARLNGPLRPFSEPPALSLKKAAKALLGARVALALLFAGTEVVERRYPGNQALPRLYRILLGVHLQRGFRRGWREAGAVPQRSRNVQCR